MSADRSDALVFFGATGDLARTKIFPALHALTRRGQLDMPVIAWPAPVEASSSAAPGRARH